MSAASTALGFARAYAEHMDGWEAEAVYDRDSAGSTPYDHIAYLVGPDDVTLSVRVDRGRVKITAKPNIPPGSSLYGVPAQLHPSITIARGRDPLAAARDILRRLAPEATALAAQVRRAVEAWEQRVDSVQGLAEKLLAEFPDLGPYGIADRDQERRTLSWSPKGNGYGEVVINTGANSGEVRLRSLSVEQLVLVLQALKTASKEV